VDKPLPELEVSRDGIKLGAALFGTAVPVDPGSHVLRATAPGAEPWSQSIDVPAGRETLTVVVPPLVAARASDSAQPASNAVTADAGSSTRAAKSSGNALLISGIATGILAAGFAVTGVLYSAAQGEFEDANVSGDSSRFDKRDRASTLGIANVVLLSATVVAGGVTVYLWLGAPASDSAASGLGVDPSFRGLSVRGTL
jgi:hypothetical protein